MPGQEEGTLILKLNRSLVVQIGLVACLAFGWLTAAPAAEAASSKVIVVKLSEQHLYAYEDSGLILDAPVTTGRPEAPTPAGTYRVLQKNAPYMFVSLNPPGHPFYYAPITANYSLRLTWTGYHLHDAPWRASFGPGTNVWHTDAWGRRRTGSLGCVNVPTGAMGRIFRWAGVGTTVVIQ